MRGRAEHARGLPGCVLGLEKPRELVVRELSAEVGQRVADHARVLDLLDRAGYPEEWLEVLPEVGADLVGGREVVPLERREPGAEGPVHQLLVELEVHQRVAPVEEDCL